MHNPVSLRQQQGILKIGLPDNGTAQVTVMTLKGSELYHGICNGYATVTADWPLQVVVVRVIPESSVTAMSHAVGYTERVLFGR